MNSKVFYGLMAIVAIGFVGVVAFKAVNKAPEQPRPGIAQKDMGRQHVQTHKYGGDEPPTSGPHAEALAWKAYDQEVPDVNAIHNLEHGGIYISYRPDLAKDQVDKIRALFTAPFSDPDFKPTKVIIAPRADNKSPIVMSSWLRSEKFTAYDQQPMINYYLKNFGKSPEPLAS